VLRLATHAGWVHLLVLANREEIGIGVFEPGDPRAGGVPYSALILAGQFEVLEADALLHQFRDGSFDIVGLPAKNRERVRLEFRDWSNAQHCFVRVKDDSELVFADEAESQNIFVECFGGAAITRRDECYDFVRAERGASGIRGRRKVG